MSKADDAQDAARDIKEQVLHTGFPAGALISSIAPEYGLPPKIVEAWLLREFKTLEALDEWGASERRAIIDREIRRQDRIFKEAQRFGGLAQIIDAIPSKALFFASLNVIGNGWSAAWRHWIRDNCPDTETEGAAFIFARSRFESRIRSAAAPECN